MLFSNQTKADTTTLITRDDCIKKAKTIDPEHPDKQCSIELSELITMFLRPVGDAYTAWTVGAEINTPINWTSTGLSCNQNTTDTMRCGEIFVTMDNKITHTVLEKTIQPGTWDISLFGTANFGVDKIELFVSEYFDIPEYLKENNMTLKIIAKDDGLKINDGNKKELYELKAIDKEIAWIQSSLSCGASGAVCSTYLTIFYDKDIAIKSMNE